MLDDLKNRVAQSLEILDINKQLLARVTDGDVKTTSKSCQISEKAKQTGNTFFISSHHDFKVHQNILSSYNESVAYAPNDSEELAAAYGNKAALLLHLRKYTESICEADQALRITKSVAMKVKLLCRKAECHTALGSSENRPCLKKARFLLAQVDGPKELEETLNKFVLKSQIVVDEGKLDTPKEVKRKAQGMKLISEAETSDASSSVRLAYSKRHGKHLVAARDIETGEFLFVEKPYFNTVPESKAFLYCYHCHKYLWTVVACENCAWRVFCSTECKNEAFNEYHKMECPIFLHMEGIFAFSYYIQARVIISLFFKALQECGGDIHHLQAQLEAIDKSEDGSNLEFLANEEIVSYKNVFSSPTRNLQKFELDSAAMSAAVALASLAKYTQLLGTVYNFDEMKKLMNNEFAISIGALLAKFSVIITSRCAQRGSYNTREEPREINLGNNRRLIIAKPSEQPLSVIPVLSQLTILNCIPNVQKILSHDNKCIAIALHPIKRGEQIASAVSPVYLNKKKSERQKKYETLYDRPCDCRACKEDWFEEPGSDGSKGILVTGPPSKMLREVKILAEFSSLVKGFRDGKVKSNHPDVSLLMKATRLVEEAWIATPMPSPLCLNALMMLMRISHAFYQPVEEHFEFSDSCRKTT